jgi:hypothetical protein
MDGAIDAGTERGCQKPGTLQGVATVESPPRCEMWVVVSRIWNGTRDGGPPPFVMGTYICSKDLFLAAA